MKKSSEFEYQFGLEALFEHKKQLDYTFDCLRDDNGALSNEMFWRIPFISNQMKRDFEIILDSGCVEDEESPEQEDE